MLKRIFTSIIGLALFFSVIFMHHYFLYLAISILIVGMLNEVYNVITVGRFMRIISYFSALVIWLGFVANDPLAGICTAVAIFMFELVVLHGRVSSKKVLAVSFSTLFIAVFMSMLVLVRKKCDQYTVILPFVCAWLTDTGAYFAGSLFGKTKLAPKISPKKTVEGALGGIVLSVIGCVSYIFIVVNSFTQRNPDPKVVVFFMLIGFVGSVISQLGDLVASCIKRDFGKKDYGSILPGHGGLMDRFDSVLFVMPFIYYAMMFITK